MQVKNAVTGAELEHLLTAEILRRARPASTNRAPASSSSIRLQEWLRAAQESATSIGRMPPVSSTLRARVGEMLVRIVRRMLFWYTPQIVSFNTAAVGALRQLTTDLERVEKRVAELESMLPAPSAELVDQAARAVESGGICILESSNPEKLCAQLEARGVCVYIVRHGAQLYGLTARKPGCGS